MLKFSLPSQAASEADRSCTFFMLDADFVRNFSGKSLPFFQEIRDNSVEEPFVEVALSYADAVTGTHLESTLAVVRTAGCSPTTPIPTASS